MHKFSIYDSNSPIPSWIENVTLLHTTAFVMESLPEEIDLYRLNDMAVGEELYFDGGITVKRTE